MSYQCEGWNSCIFITVHNSITREIKVTSVPLFLSAGGPRLKCSDLLKHVLEVLQNSYSCSSYGEDYSNLLVKDILSVRKYWRDITADQWQSQWFICLNVQGNIF